MSRNIDGPNFDNQLDKGSRYLCVLESTHLISELLLLGNHGNNQSLIHTGGPALGGGEVLILLAPAGSSDFSSSSSHGPINY